MLEQNVSPTLLREIIRYDADTGRLFWLPRQPCHFRDDRKIPPEVLCSRWNTRYAGRGALTAVAANGYRTGDIFNFTAAAHRVAWALGSGNWPKHEVDHINGIRDDNRFSNLRDVSTQTNRKNVGIRKNTSGVLGVSWNSERGRWVAQITIDGKNTYLGSFDTIGEAAEVRRQASLKHGFHPNHGDRRRVA